MQPDLFNQPQFYNTVKADNTLCAEYKKAGARQQDTVLAYFQRIGSSTTTKAADALGLNLNSVRRCVTNLAIEGKLIKSNETRIERYGKPNFIYTINKEG